MPETMEERHLRRAREFVAVDLDMLCSGRPYPEASDRIAAALVGHFEAVEADVAATHVAAVVAAQNARDDACERARGYIDTIAKLRRLLAEAEERMHTLAVRLESEQGAVKRLTTKRDRAVNAIARVQEILDDETMDLPAQLTAIAAAVAPRGASDV